jgi:HPt (histidine-containing phosphotransfer) domain-containing protein
MTHKVTVKGKIKKYMPQFMDNTKKDINLLKQASIENDMFEMERISHSIKGYGKPFGFTKLGNLAAQINREIKAKNIENAIPLIDELDTYFENIEIVYDEEKPPESYDNS